MNTEQLAKRMTGMDTNSNEYKELAVLHKKALEIENAAHAYRQKLVRGLLTLVEPTRLLNRSRILYLSNKQIIALGKAARLLNNEINKAGLMPAGEGKEKEWSEF